MDNARLFRGAARGVNSTSASADNPLAADAPIAASQVSATTIPNTLLVRLAGASAVPRKFEAAPDYSRSSGATAAIKPPRPASSTNEIVMYCSRWVAGLESVHAPEDWQRARSVYRRSASRRRRHGEVYGARDTRLNRTVATKVLSPLLTEDASFRKRFAREARAIAGLEHPNICPLYDVGAQDGASFLVMQLLQGETLASLHRGRSRLTSLFSTASTRRGAPRWLSASRPQAGQRHDHVLGLLDVSSVTAQPLGTFRWQLQPFCNVLTLSGKPERRDLQTRGGG